VIIGLSRPAAALRWSGLAFALAAGAACGPLTSTAPGAITPPPPPPPPPEVRLVSAIEAQGCELTAANVEAVLLSANLTQAELAEITPRLADAGRVVVAGTGSIRVVTDRCPA
jgi:alkanesulfonate monooxygenase SsuD/methylene tetrahydromethanopterin reductase-like flavin-dependent oxidoreductase (luciferase family)